MSEVPGQLALEYQQIYESLLHRPLCTPEMLTTMVEGYLGAVGMVLSPANGHAATVARQVGSGLLQLLRECDQDHFRHVQAAAFYFANDVDASPDADSEEGFDDDAQVFNAVCRLMGRSDLEVVV